MVTSASTAVALAVIIAPVACQSIVAGGSSEVPLGRIHGHEPCGGLAHHAIRACRSRTASDMG